MPLEIVRNDITRMQTDAIVNAANRSLLGGGGVDGAIHRAAGPELLEECRTLGGCGTGQAKITKGYRLPARYVIHTVGPVWQGGDHGERELLVSCYRNSLELAAAYRCESVAFPMISAGAYGYPGDQAMITAVETISRFLLDHDMTVYLVVFGHTEFVTGTKLFRNVREYIDDRYAETHIRPNAERYRREMWYRGARDALEREASIMADMAVGSVQEENAPEKTDAFRPPKKKDAPGRAEPPMMCGSAPGLAELLEKTDEGFSAALLRTIDERGMTDAECYKRANVDRKLFSKIRSNPDYRPSKTTALAFAVALGLNLAETEALIRKAGYALTDSSKLDIAVRYFIREKQYDIHRINVILFELDLPLLGSNVA